MSRKSAHIFTSWVFSYPIWCEEIPDPHSKDLRNFPVSLNLSQEHTLLTTPDFPTHFPQSVCETQTEVRFPFLGKICITFSLSVFRHWVSLLSRSFLWSPPPSTELASDYTKLTVYLLPNAMGNLTQLTVDRLLSPIRRRTMLILAWGTQLHVSRLIGYQAHAFPDPRERHWRARGSCFRYAERWKIIVIVFARSSFLTI